MFIQTKTFNLHQLTPDTVFMQAYVQRRTMMSDNLLHFTRIESHCCTPQKSAQLEAECCLTVCYQGRELGENLNILSVASIREIFLDN